MTLLKVSDVEARTGLSRVTIWRLERRGEFPRRRIVANRSVRWVDQEIDQWIKGLPAGEVAM